MRILRALLVAVLVSTTIVYAPATAVATDPPSGPVTIRMVTFENPYPPTGWSAGINPDPPGGITPTAWWTRASFSKRTGTYGLWCGGGIANWNTYPAGTSGRATLQLPELADYYSSDLEFYYTMPSRGAADSTSFRLRWMPISGNESLSYNFPYFGLSTGWTRSSWGLSDNRENILGNEVSLSRTSATLMWEFNDKVEGGSQTPTRGQGATLDDIVVTGYKYGPVRNLEAAVGASGMELSWDKSHRSVTNTALEDRPIVYHVWRKPSDNPSASWTHLTSAGALAGNNSVTYTDTTVAAGQAYIYRVIEYDTGGGYGESAYVTTGRIPVTDVTITGSVSPAVLAAGDPATYTYTVTNSGEIALDDMTVTDFFGEITEGVPASLAPGGSFQVNHVGYPIASNFVNTAYVTASSVTGSASDQVSVPIVVKHPSVTAAVEVDPDVVAAGDPATFTYTIANNGDTVLTDISVVDAYGSIGAGVIPSSLSPGGSFQLSRVGVTPASSVENTVSVSAFGELKTVYAEAAAKLEVTHPAVTVEASVDPTVTVEGDPVTYTYDVTNSGDTTLTTLALTDAYGPVTDGVPALLGPSESFSATRDRSPVASFTNNVTITALGTAKAVSHSDSVYLQVRPANPEIEVLASVSPSAIPEGNSATFTYAITNKGNVTLTDLAVTDYLGAISSGVPASLDPEGTFQLTRQVSPADTVNNTVTASGEFSGTPTNGQDSVVLTVTHPEISVSASPSSPTIYGGQNITFDYVIKNEGDVALSGLTLTDEWGAFADLPATLAAGASITRTRSVSPTVTMTNNVSVSGVGTGKTVNASDSATVTVTNPNIAVTAGADPSLIAAGDTTTYTYVVTNDGDVALTNLVVQDKDGQLALPQTSLAPGEGITVRRENVPRSETDTQTVTATGKGAVTQKVVSAQSSVKVTVTKPAVSAGVTANRTEIAQGSTVTFTYRIENPSGSEANPDEHVTLSGFAVSDSWGPVPGAVPPTLAPGEHFELTRIATPQTSGTNQVTVTAVGTGKTVSDSAVSSRYQVWHPSIGMRVTPSTRVVNAGKVANFDIILENTGDTPLKDVQVRADGANIGGGLALEAGEVMTQTHAMTPSVAATVQFQVVGTYGTGAPGFAGTVSASGQGSVEILEPRIAGADRISTAVALSKEMFAGPLPSDGHRAVVIATGYGYADALAAASLAGAVKGPLLLVRADSVPAPVADEIRRLAAAKAYIVGGSGVVSEGVRAYLSGTLGLTVERLAGANRYGTAAAVARKTKAIAGSPSRVFVATGGDFPDALAASSLAAELGEPIVLTKSTALSPEADALLRELRPSTVVVCGGTGAVSAGVASTLAGAAYGSPNVVRQGGVNRYDTARLLAEYGRSVIAPNGFDGVYLATGKNFPDALAGGVAAAAGEGWGPLMLTTPDKLVAQARDLIAGSDTAAYIAVVGGEGAVANAVLDEAVGLIR